MVLNIGDRVKCTQSEGPGLRYAVWVQGCPFRCPGCCNPHFLEIKEAENISVRELIEDILSQKEIEGVTFVGGEPSSQSEAITEICREVRKVGLNTLAFTGHTLEELQKDSNKSEFLNNLDTLVDGQYMAALPENKRRWIGSSNQRIFHFTDALKGRFDESPNTVEIHMKGMDISIHGYPLKFITKKLRKSNDSI